METMDIQVTRVKKSRLHEMDFNNLPFGKYFSDHMLEADYSEGDWQLVSIKPYQPILFEPSLMALHYGQSIFEGIKAYRNKNGEAFIYRPYDNLKRFNISQKGWTCRLYQKTFYRWYAPADRNERIGFPKDRYSLYIRPFMLLPIRSGG